MEWVYLAGLVVAGAILRRHHREQARRKHGRRPVDSGWFI